ncbi:MAG: hypothetical protein HYX63_05925 [Gammaproteobacteria bacterium]|nr:hypothetical protein [Gammaproteobacteria bacterium]
MELPLLRQVHDGCYEARALIAPVMGTTDQRLVLRLWSAEKLLPTRIVRRHAVPESVNQESIWDNTVLLIHQLDF